MKNPYKRAITKLRVDECFLTCLLACLLLLIQLVFGHNEDQGIHNDIVLNSKCVATT